MRSMTRIILFVIGTSAITAAHLWLDQIVLPQQAADVAVGSVNGTEAAAADARAFNVYRAAAGDALILLPVLFAAACFARPLLHALREQSRVEPEGKPHA